MAIRDVNKRKANKKDVQSFSDTSIGIVRGSDGKQRVDFNTTIDRNDTEVKIDTKQADFTATGDMVQNDYQSFDTFVRYVNDKKNATSAKKVRVKIVADNGAVYTTKVRAGQSLPQKEIDKMHLFMFNNCERVDVRDGGTGKLNVTNVSKETSKRVVSSVDANDDIKRAFLCGDHLREFYATDNFTVEEVDPSKLGIFARTLGGMVKNNALKLGVIGAGAGVLATHGTALGTGIIAAATNPATWAAIGTFAAGAAPIAIACVGAMAVANWIGKEYTKAKSKVMSS